MKKVLSFALAAILAVSLAACGSSSSSSTASSNPTSASAGAGTGSELNATIEFWSSWSETENQAIALQEAAEAFTAANPGVKINFTFNGRDNRLLVGSAMEAGTKITMMDANVDNIQALWSELVYDLSDAVQEVYPTTDGKAYIDTIMPSMMELSAELFDGKYTYFPYSPQAFMIFCNKSIFEECGITEYPETWDELMDACEIIKNAGYIPVTTDSNYATSWVGYYLSRLMGTDAVDVLKDDPNAWDDPRVLEAARAIEEMASKGYFDPNIEANVYPSAQQNMVISENVAMYINGTWLPNEVTDTTPEDFKWGSFAFPTVENGVDDQTAGCYSSYGISVSNTASPEEIEAAVAFGVYVTTEFDQQFSEMANMIPVSVDGVWPENLSDAKNVMAVYTERYPSQTAITLNTNSKQIIADACLKLMGGSITAEQFVEQASNF